MRFHIGVTHQLQYFVGLLLAGEGDGHLAHNMAESGYPAVLAGAYFPPCLDDLRHPPAQLPETVQLVVLGVLENAVGMDARLMGKGIIAHPGLIYGNGHIKGVAGELGYLPGPRKVYVVAQLVFAGQPLGLGEGQYGGYQVGVAGPLADAVNGGVYVGILAAVDGPLGPGHRVGYGHAQVAVAVYLYGKLHLLGQCLDGIVNGKRVVVAQGIAVSQSVGTRFPGRPAELNKVLQLGP